MYISVLDQKESNMPENGITEEDEIERMLDQRHADSAQHTQQAPKQTVKYVPGRGASRYDNSLRNLIPLRPKVRENPPEDNVGLFSYLYLMWFTKYLWKAYQKRIEKCDLPSLSPYNSCAYNCQRLEILWKEELGRRGLDGASFSLVVWRFARTRILLSSFLYGCSVICGFLSPAILMRKVLEYIQDTEQSSLIGLKWALLLILCEIGRMTFINWSWTLNITTARRLKSACLALLYKKIIGLNSLGNKSTGELINVFSSDGQKVFELMIFGPQIIGGPVATICGVIYIWCTLSPMALLGMIIFVLFYIVQFMLTRITKYYKSKCLKVTDLRIKTISEILESIKFIKLYAWEKFFTLDILRIRQEEKKWLSKLAFYDSTTLSLTPTVSILATILTFLAHLATEDNLTVAQAFPILSIIGIILTQAFFDIRDGAKNYIPARLAFSKFKVFPLLTFLNVQTRSSLMIVYYALLNIVEGKLTFNRFKSVLLLEETNCHITKAIVRSQALAILNGKFVCDSFEIRLASNNSNTVKGKKSKRKKSKQPIMENKRIEILSDVTFEAAKGQLIGICGHVGSGKSSLLLASLGQLRMVAGQAMRDGTCAYVGQKAWIINATFKENVIFGEKFDPKRYYRALSTCSLKEDINMLPSGDQTEIGERGVTLSGGQKQRLALARAFYANRDIYFLDDPLSAVDNSVGEFIFENLILDALDNKTVLLVTHQVQYLNRCDDIYMMHNGRIIEHGNHDELMRADKEYAAMVKNTVVESQDSSPEEDQESDSQESETEKATELKPVYKPKNSVVRKSFGDDEKTDKTDGIGKNLMVKENMERGSISANTFHVYIKAAGGYFLALLVFLVFFLNIGSLTFSSCWLAYWLKEGDGNKNMTEGNNTRRSSNINENPDFNYYQTIYASFIFIILFTSLLRAFAITGITIKAAISLHNQLFSKMISSSIRFFETTPVGRIQNLFSSDMDVVDNGIRISLEMFLQSILTCTFAILIICSVFPWFIIPLIFLTGLFYFVSKIFRVGVRDLKRFENASRSPVFSYITATTEGLHTIRAFNKEQEFIIKFQELLDENCSYEYFRNLASRWLAIRFDSLSVFCTFIVLIILICLKGSMSPALAGLALAFVAQTTGLFQYALRLISELETRFVNVERMCYFLRAMINENKTKVIITPAEEWPTQGTIEFKDVKMRYDENLPLVLDEITFSIKDGEKIGIVGRTGGGKSSLVVALFRLCELSGGKITVDGIDVAKIDLELLRSKLFIVPQDLVLFGGTIRAHVDPFGKYSDLEIWTALEKSRLKDKVASMPGQLTEPVKAGGSNLSMGERQLLCLARAILCRSKILILDEATASVDPETSSIVDQTIREEFSNCTVITIAHRLQTVLNCDRVLVMEKGQVAEFNKPSDLLSNSESRFAKMMTNVK